MFYVLILVESVTEKSRPAMHEIKPLIEALLFIMYHFVIMPERLSVIVLLPEFQTCARGSLGPGGFDVAASKAALPASEPKRSQVGGSFSDQVLKMATL